ncbi:MAG TPA: hypothetical protein PKE30_03080 [Niabella sp.]|nr:hypothetical protein [Niabella sp.]
MNLINSTRAGRQLLRIIKKKKTGKKRITKILNPLYWDYYAMWFLS